jgi:hypothetical protein
MSHALKPPSFDPISGILVQQANLAPRRCMLAGVVYVKLFERGNNKDGGSQFAGKMSGRPSASSWADKKEREVRSGQKQALLLSDHDLKHNQGGGYSPTESF